MNIAQTISQYSKQLKSSSPILDTELLLSCVLNKPKEYLYAYPEKKLTTSQLHNFTTLFKRRIKGEPIAYILGHKEFFGLDFKVNKNVLIPRPETEQLVEEVIKYYNQSEIHAAERHPASRDNPQSKISIMEIGVGSGAVIISLAQNLTKPEYIGTDISSKALAVAKQNAKINKVKIKFLQGNLLTPLKSAISNPQSSIIVANLPYLTTLQLNNQQLHYEPKTALAGDPDGLKYYREFFNQLQQYKLRPQAIFLEIGHNQGNKLTKLTKQALPKYKMTVKKDMCGFDRILLITK